jgi:glycerate 2-kinase
MRERRTFLESLFKAAVAAADPAVALPGHLPPTPPGRTIVIGAGKASAGMARALEQAWDASLSGCVVTRYGHGVSCERIEVLEAGHPVPDENSLRAGEKLLGLVAGLTGDDLVIALISGGGSALLAAPPPGLSLADEQALNEVLLAGGAPITAMNAIRKHVSRVKGGRLAAAAHPARVVSLIISDVPGDDPAQVASGPTVADRTSIADALAIIGRYRLELPPAVLRHIQSPASRCPRTDDRRFSGHEVAIIASAALSLQAAAEIARREGIAPHILSDAIEGEARDVGLVHAAIAREVALRDRPFARPALLLSGGETTVTLRSGGRGGRNTEFLLSFALAINGTAGISALAADTDGIDGTQQNAGAFADGDSARRLVAMGRSGHEFLTENDSWAAFDLLGDLFEPGPTGTNVNDFRAILIGEAG